MDKNPRIFRSNSENSYTKTRFLKKNILWENVSCHVIACLAILPKKNFTKNPKNSLLEKTQRIKICWGLSFLKRFPGTRRKQNWHSGWKCMPKLEKVISQFIQSSKSYSGGIWLHFDRTPEKVSRNSEKFFTQGPKKSGIKVYIEAFFSSEKSCGHVKCSF